MLCRSHQLRVHMQHIGHPIINDPLYATPGLDTCHSTSVSSKRFALHAFQLHMNHPMIPDTPMVIQAPYAYTSDGMSTTLEGSSVLQYVPCNPLVPVHGDDVDMGFTPDSYNRLTDHTNHLLAMI